MLRNLVICVLAAGVLAASASAGGAGSGWRPALRPQLAPGVTYERQVQFTRRGPLVLHTITAPKPTGNFRLEPVLSNGAITGRERLSVIARRLGNQVVSVSGDLFFPDGRPHGILIQNGVLHYAPAEGRSSLGIDAAGNLDVERVELNATWNGSGQRRPLLLNREPTRNGVSLFTPAWGPVTPGASATIEAVVTLPPTVPNTEVTGPVTSLRQGNGPIPPGSAVLVGRGAGGQQLVAEARVGTQIGVRFPLKPAWTGIVSAIGGGPVLVRDGRGVFRAREAFASPLLSARQARAGIGQRADGRLVLVVAEGGRFGYSVGLSNFELARALVRLGAVTGFALAPGLSTALASDGQLITRPARGGERLLADALQLAYRSGGTAN